MDTAVAIETIRATEKFLVPPGTQKPEGRMRDAIVAFLGGVFNNALVAQATGPIGVMKGGYRF